jgi:hypothetical protein
VNPTIWHRFRLTAACSDPQEHEDFMEGLSEDEITDLEDLALANIHMFLDAADQHQRHPSPRWAEIIDRRRMETLDAAIFLCLRGRPKVAHFAMYYDDLLRSLLLPEGVIAQADEWWAEQTRMEPGGRGGA